MSEPESKNERSRQKKKTVRIKGRSKISLRRKNILEFDKVKTAMTLDYIFGAGISNSLDFEKISFVHSRKTGRIRQLEDSESRNVLFTFRPNGTIAPTAAGASVLLSAKRNIRSPWVITVMNGVSEFVSSGKTVFCKHVVSCNDSLRAGEDVVIVNEQKEILAVGKSVISGIEMKQFKRGQAVKVREGVH